jgi:Tfp pilus assembly PilM family ATPase
MRKTSGGSSSARLPIGVDISATAIKAVEIEDTLDGVAVTAVGAAPTPPGSLERGRITDVRAVARTVREVVHRGRFTSRRAAMGLGGEALTLRWIQLPNLSGEELTAAARYEARKFLRHETEAMAVEALRLGEGSPDAESIRVLVAAAPHAVVEMHAEAALRAGLVPTAVEIEPIAVLRALMRSAGPRGLFWRDQPMAFVLLDQSTMGMYVGQRGELRFSRTIPMGERGEEETDPVRVAREISRLLSYYRSLFPERSYEGILDRVTLSGPGACTPGLTDELAKRLGIRIEVGNPFAQTAVRIDGATFAAIDGRQPHFVVAVGLALGGIQETRWRARSDSLLKAAPDPDAGSAGLDADAGAIEEAASA